MRDCDSLSRTADRDAFTSTRESLEVRAASQANMAVARIAINPPCDP